MEIGRYRIPKNRLSFCVMKLRQLIAHVGLEKAMMGVSHEEAAKAMGYSTSRSGPYLQLIADMRAYGLLKRNGRSDPNGTR